MPSWGRKKEITCPFCKQRSMQFVAAINRAKKVNAPIYCNRICAGMGRRKNKTIEQKKSEKRQYDIEYRAKNRAMLKAKKKEYFQRTYDPFKAAEIRKKRMHLHVQYCKQPWYREWKKEYDKKYLAKKQFGEFWESARLLIELEKELDEKMSWYDRQMAKGTLNKANQRRRDYERSSIR